MTTNLNEEETGPKLPAYSNSLRCLEHPDVETVPGYGLAGGGMGLYTSCPVCHKIVSKNIDPDENEEGDEES